MPFAKSAWILSLIASLATSLPPSVNAQSAPASATIARDVNGFELGMTVAEAKDLAPLSYIGGDQFDAKVEGISYNFGVTPKGRIYRVQSSQELGHFEVDRSFLKSLGRKLAAKYGKPDSQYGEVFNWGLTETVTHRDGQRLPCTTMWMSAYVGGSGSDQTLEITIVDFRILWADQAAVNKEPSQRGAEKVQF